MTTEVVVLDPNETSELLATRPWQNNTVLADIQTALKQVVDTNGSIFVTGLTDSRINSLRVRMRRYDMYVSVNKANRDGVKGHVIKARTVEDV